MKRVAPLVAVVTFVAIVAVPASAQVDADDTIIIKGHGAAHGFGLAMDGVEGQARAGWNHDRILSLFYADTQTSQKSGTIRVGLTSGGGQHLDFPSGGEVSDRPFGSGAGEGFPLRMKPGGSIEVGESAGGLTLRTNGAETPPQAAGAEAQTHNSSIKQAEDPSLDLEPLLSPTPAPTDRSPPDATPKQQPAAPKVSSFWVRGAGDPALVRLAATGRRYRGVMEVRRIGPAATRAVNHVDLETYVAGIAEEKGQGWPIEGLKTLAVAARTLGAATMTWYGKHQADGYDICPSANCQVYLGYDGEEPALRRAVAETAGQIRTYNGRPIMAMYHGNGGGQTETYSRVADGGGTPHPYLRSVRYPHADPSTWERTTTLREIASALRAQGVKVPNPLQLVEVAERGDSPRVLRLRLAGGRDEESTVRGTTFKTALGLRSTWFDFEAPAPGVPATLSSVADVSAPATLPPRHDAAATVPGFPWKSAGAASAATLCIAAGALMIAQAQQVKVIPGPLRALYRRVRRPSAWREP
jgi:SpoIID/LytB domain protein